MSGFHYFCRDDPVARVVFRERGATVQRQRPSSSREGQGSDFLLRPGLQADLLATS